MVGSAIGATIPTTFGQTKCNVLVDTEAMKSCISQAYYQELMFPTTRPIHTYQVKSANGSNLYWPGCRGYCGTYGQSCSRCPLSPHCQHTTSLELFCPVPISSTSSTSCICMTSGGLAKLTPPDN